MVWREWEEGEMMRVAWLDGCAEVKSSGVWLVPPPLAKGLKLAW